MMLKKFILQVVCLTLATFFSCNQKPDKNRVDIWKREIMETELEFSNMAQKEGMNVAFLEFVADDGVLLRNETLIKGKDNIRAFMKNSVSKGLSWKPDFVDVSGCGDLGYTYGTYTYRYTDSLQKEQISTGIFHTVWKRQQNGSWKFVWD